jgi:DNA-binding FadR family transcriptional regulator
VLFRSGITIVRDPVLLELRHYFAERYDTPERFADAQEFRAALEWGFGPLALSRVKPETVRALRAIIREVRAAGPGKADIEGAEVRFHTVLTAGCGNRLAALFAHLYVPLFRLQDVVAYGQTQAEIDGWTAEHGALAEALAARDAARFRAALKAHTHGYMRWPKGQPAAGDQ